MGSMRLNAPRNNGLETEMRNVIMGAAAAAMLAGSSVAQAAPVAIESPRAGTSVTGEELRGKSGTHLLLGALALGILIFILFQINDDEDDQVPISA